MLIIVFHRMLILERQNPWLEGMTYCSQTGSGSKASSQNKLELACYLWNQERQSNINITEQSHSHASFYKEAAVKKSVKKRNFRVHKPQVTS